MCVTGVPRLNKYFVTNRVNRWVIKLRCKSLSTVVLNSRDWSEIVWLPEISRFKNQPCNRLYPKTHWNALVML